MNKRLRSCQTTIRILVVVLILLLMPIMAVSASIPIKAKIIFNFDDPSWQDSVNLIDQTLSSNNQRGVLFVVTSDSTDSLLQSYHQLYNNGWDISSHTVTHSDLTTLNDQQLQSELNDSYDWLITNGFSRSAGYLAYPYGAFDTRVVDATKKRYVIARSVIYGLQDTITAGDYAIKIFEVDDIISPQEVMGEIDTAISQNKTLVLLFHTIVIDNPAPSTYTYSQSNLQQISNYIKSKSNAIDVVTYSDLLTTTPPPTPTPTPTLPQVQDDFENVLFNNRTYLTIPTYDGSGQAVHPDVYYNASGWKGYKYWMAMTPYPNTNSDFENPSIVTSNDGYNWVVPQGLTNPIVLPISGYDSDPNLAFKNGTLYLYYREVSTPYDILKMKSSNNGITWSPEQTLLELPNYQLIAPAVVYNSADGLFYLWYVDTGTQGSQATSTQVILRNSNDGIHWSSPQIVPISIPGKIIWHINTQYIPELNEYWMVISAGTGVVTSNNELFFAYSIDKLNWNVLPGKILGPGKNWDNEEIYQSAINYINNSVKIWYSAASIGTLETWHMGYSETSLTDLKKDYHWEYYNKIGDFYRNSLQVKNGQYSAMLKFDGNVNEYVDVRRKVSVGQNLSFEIDFYDDGNATGMKLFRVVSNINEMVGIGVWTISSSAFYSYHDKIYTYKITSIPRTVGWHKFRISIQNDKSSTFYIDDINVGALSSQFNDPAYVQLSSGFYKGVFYVDNLNVYQNSEANTLPSITTQPGAQNVQVGQTAIFSVVAAGTLPLSYQWQKNGVNISQAYGSSYVTPPLTLADSGSAYRVIVSNALGSVTSNSAVLTVSTTVNILDNGNFESGTTSWTFYTSGTGTFNVQPPGFEGNNAAMLALSSTGTNIQLFQNGITLETNTRYRLSFAAYSTTGHDVTVMLFQHVSPYTAYMPDFEANLGTSWQTFTTEFNTTTGTVSDGRLMFWFPDFASAGDTYYIDAIRLEKVIAAPISPVVVGNSPTGQNVPIAARISVNFSKPMNQASVQSSFSTIPATTGNFTWSGNNTTYTPGLNFVYNTTYSVTVGTGAMDSAGNNMLSLYTWPFTTVPDIMPPSVIGNTPTGINVSISSMINVTFSEAMNKSTTESAFSTFPATTGSFSWSGNNMTYTPVSNLAYNTTYNITVGTGAKDAAGNNMTSYTWPFTTVPDRIPPLVISTTPTGINVSISSRINVTFSEAMNKSTAESAFSTFPAITGSFSWSGNNMTYIPVSNLAYNTTYNITVGTGAKDVAGNNMISSYTWPFTTSRDMTPPSIIGKTPNGTNVPISSQITVTFGKAMNYASAQSAFSTSPATTGSFTWSGNNMTYTPLSNLAYNTTYNVTIGTGARDLEGNNMLSSYTWPFTTSRDMTPPSVIGTTPDGTNVPIISQITATFSKAMNNVSAESAFSTSPATTGSFSWSGKNMIYTPSSNLAYGANYNVTIGTGAMDLEGNNMPSPNEWQFTTIEQDLTPPAVIENSPIGINISITSRINVTFSEAMNKSSTESAFSTLPATTGSFSWSGNNMTYTPTSNVAYNTTYNVTIGTGAMDLEGNNMLSSYTWPFTTVPDRMPPLVIRTTPTGSNVSIVSRINATFNKAMNKSTVESSFSTIPATTGSFSWIGNNMTYTPDSNLAYNTTYNVIIGTGSKDVEGNNLASTFTWPFITSQDTTPPYVIGTTPNGTNVPLVSQITVTFSKAMNNASAQSAFSTSPATTGSFSWSGNNMTYIPISNLAYNTTYNVTVGTGAMDSTGNNILASYTWRFTTVPDRIPPLIISTAPTGINVSIASRINVTFNEAMNKSTAESAFSIFPATTGSFSWTGNNMTYTPVSNFAYNTTYNIIIGTGAKDIPGNNMTSSFTWPFTTSRDMTPPSVIGTTPNGTNVPILSPITVTFGKAMNNVSAESAFSTSPATTGSFSWSGNTMKYTPASNLSYNTAYIVTVGIGATDLAGNNMPSSYTWQFITAPLSINIISNPGFESSTASWAFYTSGTGTFSTASPGFEGNNAAKLTFNSAGTNIQLFQTGIILETNTRYRLSFSAYSTTGHDVTVRFIKHVSPYTAYAPDFKANLSGSWQTFTTEFNTTGYITATVNDGRLMFWFADFAAAGDTYYLDAIRLEKVIATPPILPVVVGNSPTGQNVPIAARISVNFSKPMNQASVQSAFSTIPATTGNFTWSGNNTTYTPGSNFVYNTTYSVTVGTGAMDSAGNNMLSSYTWPFTTVPDIMPPSVIGNTPTGINVSIASRINLTFSEAMNKPTAESAFSTFPATTGSFSWSGNNMTYTPASNLAYNTTYNVIIGTGAKDGAGNNMTSSYTWPFTTVPDRVPPLVISTAPTGINVSIASRINVTFSEAMNKPTAESSFSTFPATTGSFSWIGNNMTYTPVSNLAYNTTYNVAVGTGVMDSAGNNMTSSYTWPFTTSRNMTPPSVIGNTPNGTNVPIISQITVTFSKPMNNASAQSAFFTSPVTTGSFSWGGNNMTYIPISNLAYNTTYNVTVGTGAMDSTGNNMLSSYSWRFTTVSDIMPPSVFNNSPTGINAAIASRINVTFSEAMNKPTAESSFSTLPATTGSFSWMGNTMIFIPVSNLAYNTTYNVIIGTGAKDSAGNSMTSSYTWPFTTVRDTTPPTVIGTTPNGTNVPIISQINVTFGKAMNNSSVQSAFSTSPATTGSFSWSGNTMKYTPASNLSYNTTYIVTVGTGARDLAGNNMSSSYTWQFITAPLSINIISNPGFESGTASWTLYTSGTGTFSTASPGFEGNNAAKLTFNSAGTNIQLYQTGITLLPNTRYRLSFSAYSTTGHDMTVRLIKHVSPYTSYAPDFTANLGTSWQTFTTDFNTTGFFTGTVSDGRLMFWFADYAGAGDIYYIDAIRLEKV